MNSQSLNKVKNSHTNNHHTHFNSPAVVNSAFFMYTCCGSTTLTSFLTSTLAAVTGAAGGTYGDRASPGEMK